MSVLGVVRQLRSPSVAVLALALTASLPAAASARSSVTIAGAPAKRLRMCGAVHKTLSIDSGARITATVGKLPHGTRTLAIARCGGGTWSSFKTARLHRGKVRLPRLPAGGYRLSAR